MSDGSIRQGCLLFAFPCVLNDSCMIRLAGVVEQTPENKGHQGIICKKKPCTIRYKAFDLFNNNLRMRI
ncbi:MAG: hypothetical protein ACQES0_08675, partial [Bacteroidota bacterium]